MPGQPHSEPSLCSPCAAWLLLGGRALNITRGVRGRPAHAHTPGFLQPIPGFPATDPSSPCLLPVPVLSTSPAALLSASRCDGKQCSWSMPDKRQQTNGRRNNAYVHVHIYTYVCIHTYVYAINKTNQPSPPGDLSSAYCSGRGLSSLPSHLLMKSPKLSSFLPRP